MEGAIESQRKKVAADVLALQERLVSIKTKKSKLQKLIADIYEENVEQQALPDEKRFDFIEFEESQS